MFRKIFIFLIIICTSFNGYAYERDEKRAYEEIEALLLKEDFAAVKTKCIKFMREYRTSRLRSKVSEFKDMAERKLDGECEYNFYAAKQKEEVTREKTETYIVQVAAFENYNNAIKTVRKLKKRGYETVIVKEKRNGKMLYKIRAGRFNVYENADSLAKALNRKGYKAEIINEK